MKIRLFPAVVLATALIAPAGASAQQKYPTKSVRLVLPFAAGSAVDVLARLYAQRMTEGWGQQVVVDNRTGASGRPRAVNRVPACGMRTSASRDACR